MAARRDSALHEGMVLDSWAVLAWMQEEPAAIRVDVLLNRAAFGALTLRCSVINAGEVYYQLVRAGKGSEAAEFWSSLVRGEMPVRIATATTPRVKRAAAIKAAYPLAYADAFAVALAIELGWPLVTGDPEIQRPAGDGLLTLEWLGR
ncbi:MAG: type II toxin-antitoxin system VapC family toxin [Chloroflexota bacterium]